jgi:glycine/D-amino acid oxidase-like deaminating enzyme
METDDLFTKSVFMRTIPKRGETLLKDPSEITIIGGGIMSYTLGGKPIFGPVPTLEGFYVATGLCRGGTRHRGVRGRLMANLLDRG